jgi:hypothetical protein
MLINELRSIELPSYMSKKRLLGNYIRLRFYTILSSLKADSLFRVRPWRYASLPHGVWGGFTRLFSIYFSGVSPRYILDSFVVKRTMLPATIKQLPFKSNMPVIKTYFQDSAVPCSIEYLSSEVPRLFSGLSKEMIETWLWSYYYPFYLFREQLTKETALSFMPVELGAGTGLFSHSFRNANEKDVVVFDLPAVLHLQSIVKDELNKRCVNKSELHQTSSVQELKSIVSGEKYSLLSFWAFTEFPQELRDSFISLIANSEFSLFASNQKFEGVSNKSYFEDIVARIPNKRAYFMPIDWIPLKDHFYILIK